MSVAYSSGEGPSSAFAELPADRVGAQGAHSSDNAQLRELFTFEQQLPSTKDSNDATEQLVGGDPSLRFCVLDDPTKTPELFRRNVQELSAKFLTSGEGLYNFFAYGRDRGRARAYLYLA